MWVSVVLAAAFLGGLVAKRIKQPALVGYLLAGLIIGAISRRFLPAEKVIWPLAEMGIAFLMFTLGLELSFQKFRKINKMIIWAVFVQIMLVAVGGLLIFPRLGFDFYSSLFLGSAFSLSSTAVVVKILSETGQIEALPGEIMLGWLLVQDLAVLPMVIILPALAGGEIDLGRAAISILKASTFLAAVVFIGKRLVPTAISRVANLRSRELLLLSVVSFCLLVALLTSAFGLSVAIGAFLAGLLISETAERHAVFSEIRPLRDLFSIIFFVSLGMFLPTASLGSQLINIVGVSFGLIFLKLIVVMILVFYLGYHVKTAIIAGLGLVQVGEFAFILAGMGLAKGLIEEDVYLLILGVAILTLLLTPWLMESAPKVYLWLRRTSEKYSPRIYHRLFVTYDQKLSAEEGLPLANHVVICGHGRVGSWLGRALGLLEIPYIVVDYNHQLVADLNEKGVKALYGDPADIKVLDYAQVDKAKIVVVAIPDQATGEMVVANCLTLNPGVKIISRIHHQQDQGRLKALGVTNIIQPEFEASLSIIHRVLQLFGVDKEDIAGKIKRLKIEHGMDL